MKLNKQYVVAMSAILVFSAASFPAQRSNSSLKEEVALRAAIEQETVRGDLTGAIQAYKKLGNSKDPVIAARALFRLAESHRKLADNESLDIYQRIVDKFPDQREIYSLAVARVKEGAPQTALQSGAISNNPRWDVPLYASFWGSVSHHGRYLPYGSRQDGEVYIHEFGSGATRQITKGASTERVGRGAVRSDQVSDAPNFAFSRDDKQLAYSWRASNRYQLRVVNLEGSGIPQPRILVQADDIQDVEALDWSPDKKWIAAAIWRTDRQEWHLVLVSVQDGTIRPLMKSARDPLGNDYNAIGHAFFSADGKYLAYNPYQRDAKTRLREVVILELDGDRQIPVTTNSVNDLLIGWSPGGTQLILLSERTDIGGRNGPKDTSGLFAIPFRNGAIGALTPLLGAGPCAACGGRNGSGSNHPSTPAGFGDILGLDDSGSLYYRIVPPILGVQRVPPIPSSEQVWVLQNFLPGAK